MTVRRSFYDVVVVGASLPALAAGALLARRGFRVTVVGHDARSAAYEVAGFTLRRALATVCAADTPAFRRVFAELALLPAVRRRMAPLAPAWQVVLPRHRVDVHGATEALQAELLREFPETQRPMEDFHAAVTRANAQLDGLFAEDLPWPPEGIFERRRASRWLRRTPFGTDGRGGDLLAEFSAAHPFRAVVESQCRFATALDPAQLGDLARARLHALGLGAATLDEGDLDGLRRTLEEKILQHGGDVRPRDRVEEVLVRGDAVRGVRLTGTDEELGCAFVVSSLDGAGSLRLARQSAPRAYAERLLGARPALHRYVLNVVLPAEALPVAMGRRVFLVGDPARPLVEENLLAVETSAADREGFATVSASALLPRSSVEEGEGFLGLVRGRVLARLEALVPFMDRHALLIDSVHDGLAPELRRALPQPVALPRRAGAEPMETLDRYAATGAFGVFAMPWRTSVAGLLLVGRSVCPGLGLEGELLSALTVARSVTQTDRSKERMRRELWSKVES